jgi:hypothetical protein
LSDKVSAAHAESGGSGPLRGRLGRELDVHVDTDVLVEQSAWSVLPRSFAAA